MIAVLRLGKYTLPSGQTLFIGREKDGRSIVTVGSSTWTFNARGEFDSLVDALRMMEVDLGTQDTPDDASNDEEPTPKPKKGKRKA